MRGKRWAALAGTLLDLWTAASQYQPEKSAPSKQGAEASRRAVGSVCFPRPSCAYRAALTAACRTGKIETGFAGKYRESA